MDNAQSAAIHDYRFPPVQPDEVDKLEIEISVLTAPKPLTFTSPEDLLKKLVPHRDGVILQIGSARATYLPQVWEQLPDKAAFLSSLAQKAGCEATAWRKPGATVQIYHVEAFKEAEFK
jgi:AmmeMemoRadiSam system protein A